MRPTGYPASNRDRTQVNGRLRVDGGGGGDRAERRCAMVTRLSSSVLAVTGSRGLNFRWGLHLWYQRETKCSFSSPSGKVDWRRQRAAIASFGLNSASARGLSSTPPA
jgi:hypothetical protein